ncbi:unnamed protein product [Eruca vesicaria subsp. sativa]|uniref:Transcription elongation factor spt6 n=1 Tax=Eruca vesicaria subsp. sativa TaxID=29727 RepID=A0ABC8KYW2_ERUVS|nr:unnamed protein product [Eruca vesicaria subsp. sativa]
MKRNNIHHHDDEEPQIDEDDHQVMNQNNHGEEEEDVNDNHYDYDDGFLTDGGDDDEDEPMQHSDEDHEDDFNLHEDDYQLLQENEKNLQKKFKRLKKKSDDDYDELNDFIVDEDDGVRNVIIKKRKYMQGSDSKAFHDVFGDPEEMLKLREKDLASRIEDEVEPPLLSERDVQIRKLDVPERIQLFEEATEIDEINIEEESNWIHAQLVHEEAVPEKDDISRFLELYHVHKLDIPFIAMYRKEQCRSLLDDDDDNPETTKWHKVLWMIHDLDRKWLLLRKRKTSLLGYFKKQTSLLHHQNVFESAIKSLEAAETEREVDDVDSKFSLCFPVGEGQYKRPNRTSQYSVCVKSGLREVVSKFGYSAEKLGRALSLEEILVDEMEDAKETPEETALSYVCAMFGDSQAVLKGARHMAAVEISCDPLIKKYVRTIYMENAVVSTRPTQDGNVVMDNSYHRFSGVKWLREKPLNKFEGVTQWLLIQKAEEEKLLQVIFKLPESCMNRLIRDFSEHYLSNGVSKYAQLWNEQRRLILEDAVHGFLLPAMEKEARLFLTSRAKSLLLSDYGQVLWNKASSGPYRKEDDDVPRVLACCWGPGNPQTTFAMLDASGELLDVLYTRYIGSRDEEDRKRKKDDYRGLSKFIKEHQPDVVALGAVNMSCVRLKDDIYEVIFEIMEEMLEGMLTFDLPLVYADESLPRQYENSGISSEQLPGQPGIVRRAVAIGRYLQNPLAMIATLCGPGKEVLSWKLHSLQDLLEPDERYKMVEQVMVDVTNQVGINVNFSARHEWSFSPLQFVSGLGPRKASLLQRSLVRAGSVFSRKELMINHGLGEKVFTNAAGFLRISRTELACNSNRDMDLLDDTRIHPESYRLAQELEKDVYDQDPDLSASLRRIDIDEYLRCKKQENKKETYVDITRELTCGFQDYRSRFKEISQDEEFNMISGETIGEGRIVEATVKRVTSGKAICVLDCGLKGILMKEDYSDDDGKDILDLSNKLCEGDVLTCKIRGVQKNRYFVFLSCKESEMKLKRNVGEVDDYYYHEYEDQNSVVSEKKKTVKAKNQFKHRMIVHPRFQNITAEEARVYLSDKNNGESIIRPSSRGCNYLTLMIKIFDNVYVHKEIFEGEKEKVSLQSIGKTLKIGDETFEDIDEVMYRYVDPFVVHLMTMLSYRKFRNGTKSEIDSLLRSEKEQTPTMVVYCFGVSLEYPGSFVLSYVRSANPHHEYIGLSPKGFKFRKRMFGDVDKLVSYFKRHIKADPELY